MANSTNEQSKDWLKILACVVVGLVIWFCPWLPADLPAEGLHMLAIFVATIMGIILKPLPMGAVALIGMTVAVTTGLLKPKVALSGFSSSSVWLVAIAFFISRAIIKSGLGERLAYIFISKFGKKTISLVYALYGVDLMVGPATPSSAARSGGIFYPIGSSIARSFGSLPEDGTGGKIGSYLLNCLYHGDTIVATMFLTAGAAKPLAQELAAGLGVEITWGNWFLGALVPGLISLALIPIVFMKLDPPEIKETPNAPKWADDKIHEMGPITKNEKYTAIIVALSLILWMTGSLHPLSSLTVALIAVSLLLITGVLKWSEDVTATKGAWNTLMWFAILVMMAGQLTEFGFIPWLSETVSGMVSGLSPAVIFIVLCLVYFYSHYLFASLTAHVTAMYPAFLGVALAAGVPPLYAALALAYVTNICASTTHYASAAGSIIFSSGYFDQKEWWKNSFIMGIIYLVVWLGIGTVWMKLIGYM